MASPESPPSFKDPEFDDMKVMVEEPEKDWSELSVTVNVILRFVTHCLSSFKLVTNLRLPVFSKVVLLLQMGYYSSYYLLEFS